MQLSTVTDYLHPEILVNKTGQVSLVIFGLIVNFMYVILSQRGMFSIIYNIDTSLTRKIMKSVDYILIHSKQIKVCNQLCKIYTFFFNEFCATKISPFHTDIERASESEAMCIWSSS